MNFRVKGQRGQKKAKQYAEAFPHVTVIPLYQTSRFATPQPFDLLILREDYVPLLVEVRCNQWRTGRASTRTLVRLPGYGVHKQIWRFRDGRLSPDIREWESGAWRFRAEPWEEQ